MGNKFLSHIREVDAIVHVVRCFVDSNVTHVSDAIDPVADITTINLELILADIETVNARLAKAVNMQKTGEKKYKTEAELLKRILSWLESEKPVRTMEFDEDERALVDEMFLLTSKPVIYAANIAEDDIGKPDNDLVKLVEKSRRRKFRNVSYLRQGGGRIIQSSLGRKSDVFWKVTV